MENKSNPLKEYFRKPGIWIALPSKGAYYDGTLSEINDMGEIPVFPMTAKDELILKNADALLNGSAITQLVKSCVPCIADPTVMPAVDLDAVLIAIKRCTYGDKISITAKHDCDTAEETEFDINLNALIGSIETFDSIPAVDFDNGIKANIRPITVKDILSLNMVQYEQVRAIQIADQKNIDEKAKLDVMQKSYEALTNAGITIVSNSIESVTLPDGASVVDHGLILEWVSDLPRNEYAKLEKSIMTTNNKGIKKEFEISCPQCKKMFTSKLDLNPTTFFA